MKNILQKWMHILPIQKETKGDIALNDIQHTTISLFNIPLFERKRILLGCVSIPFSGGGYIQPEVQTIKSYYIVFNITIWIKKETFIAQNHKKQDYSLWIYEGLGDFCALGKYALESSHLNEEILKLCQNLPLEDQERVVRQVALSKAGYEKKDFLVYALTQDERRTRQQIDQEFLTQIFKISDDLFFYKGYFLPKAHFEVGVFWHKHSLKEVFSQQTLKHIRQNNIIDVGGFIGDSAIIFEKEFCDKTIYSFEPTQENFALMQQTLKLNHSTRIVPINKGLGAQIETQEIAVNTSASSILYSVGGEKEQIHIITLDSFILENNLKIGFIKVDIEGFEMEFLKGAQQTICQQKPALLISIYHSGKDYFGIKPLIESWNLGYKMRIFKGCDFSLHCETALYCSIENQSLN